MSLWSKLAVFIVSCFVASIAYFLFIRNIHYKETVFDLLRSSLKKTNPTSHHFILMASKNTKVTETQRTMRINILSTINKHQMHRTKALLPSGNSNWIKINLQIKAQNLLLCLWHQNTV